VTIGVEAGLKENAGVGGLAAGVRVMMFGSRDGVTGACAFAPSKVGVARDGLGTAEVEHEESVTVTVDSTRTVLMPSEPVDVKMDGPPGATEFGGTVGAGARAGDGGVAKPPKLKLDEEEVVAAPRMGGVPDGTIPPKLNVLVEDVEPNWRLFSLMTGGEAAGALRLMGGGLAS
jgi:hypothetical protein